MKKIAILIFFAINSTFLFAQISLTLEGTNVNNSESPTWNGVNIQRSVPTSFMFRNNIITSINTSGYMLQAGDEGISTANNNLDGEIITGNKLVWNGTDISSTITHGIFTGYNINAVVKYNYLNKIPMAIIRKSNGMTNTAGGVAYNIVNKTGATAIVVKGMNGVLIYNNTLFSDEVEYTTVDNPGTWRGLIDIYSNTDITPNCTSTGTKIKNNIFYTKNQIYNIYIYDAACLTSFESDYNVYYCEAGAPMFNYLGTAKTFTQWQALGYDIHSKVINPNFIDFTDFVPASRLDYGANLGTTWQTGLSTAAVWTLGSSPSTTDQNGTWQVGARVYAGSVVAANPVFVSSVVENDTPALLEMTYSLNLANIVPANAAFNVLVNSVANTVNSVVISGNKVQLTLASPIKYGDIVTVSYTNPVTNPLQTSLGGMAISITGKTTINNLIKTVIDTPVTIKMTISPNHVHKLINVSLVYTGSLTTQANLITPEIIRIFDLSGNLFFEKLLVTGVTNVKIPLSLDSGIYTVLMIAGGFEMASQKIVVY
jgi:uncharacterized repeat protein (TIGR02059 family)